MSVIASRSHTADRAEDLLQRLQLKTLPVDVAGVAKRLGISVSLDVLEDEVSGFLIVRGGRAGISINAKHPLNRQRFTLAHELGHFELHHPKRTEDSLFVDKSLVYLRGPARGRAQDPMEREADEFAAALLMPESMVRHYLDAHRLNPAEEIDFYRLTMAFKVSEQAMHIRLLDLGILD